MNRKQDIDQGDDFPPTWILIRPLPDPDGVPASVRVRRALKCLLRAYRLRVVKVTNVGPRGERAVRKTKARKGQHDGF